MSYLTRFPSDIISFLCFSNIALIQLLPFVVVVVVIPLLLCPTEKHSGIFAPMQGTQIHLINVCSAFSPLLIAQSILRLILTAPFPVCDCLSAVFLSFPRKGQLTQRAAQKFNKSCPLGALPYQWLQCYQNQKIKALASGFQQNPRTQFLCCLQVLGN